MKSEGFSLIEVMVAVLLLALTVLFLSAVLGGGFRQSQKMSGRQALLIRGENAVETALAYEDEAARGIELRITPYGDGEKVEVFHGETGEKLFSVYRPKKGLYAP